MGGGPPTGTSVLHAAAQALGFQNDHNEEEALLTEMGELFRTGLLARGKNLSSPDPPWFHRTERGRQALEGLPRDPCNPARATQHRQGLFGRYQPLQLFHPVLHDDDLWRGGRIGLLDHEEAAAIGGHVIGPARITSHG